MSSSYSDARRNLLEKSLRGELLLRRAQPSIPRRSPHEPVPLSYSQEQVWLHAQLVPDIPLYNEPVTIHFSGDLNIASLEASFNEILRRHEAWRTCFKIVDGKPLQDVKPALAISLPVVDLRTLPPGLTPEQQREWAVLDTFDMFSPEYDNPQRVKAVAAMFRRSGAEVFFAGFVDTGTAQTAVVRAIRH